MLFHDEGEPVRQPIPAFYFAISLIFTWVFPRVTQNRRWQKCGAVTGHGSTLAKNNTEGSSFNYTRWSKSIEKSSSGMDTFVIYRPFAFSSAQSQRDGYYSAKPIPEVWSGSMAFGFKVVHPLSRPMKHGTSRELHVERGRTSSLMSRPSFLLFSAWRQSQTEAMAKLLTQTIPLTSKSQ